MHLCYIDESGTPEVPGTTSHYVLAGLSIPIEKWTAYERSISTIKAKYQLVDKEVHTGWIMKSYVYQNQVKDFEKLNYSDRRQEVERLRRKKLLALQKDPKQSYKLKQTKKNFQKTADYLHLTYAERLELIKDLAKAVSRWTDARLFAECIDKVHFNHNKLTPDIQAFEQLVSRFETFLKSTGTKSNPNFGLLIHDNNETVAKKHTDLMKGFHASGTLWTRIENIIETPLFVNSSLTSLIQIADLCSYAIRRYLENNEREIFDLIYKRADRKFGVVVGVRHFTNDKCECVICTNHRAPFTPELFES